MSRSLRRLASVPRCTQPHTTLPASGTKKRPTHIGFHSKLTCFSAFLSIFPPSLDAALPRPPHPLPPPSPRFSSSACSWYHHMLRQYWAVHRQIADSWDHDTLRQYWATRRQIADFTWASSTSSKREDAAQCSVVHRSSPLLPPEKSALPP
eukprot:1012303-Rhodomonas_salina.1